MKFILDLKLVLSCNFMKRYINSPFIPKICMQFSYAALNYMVARLYIRTHSGQLSNFFPLILILKTYKVPILLHFLFCTQRKIMREQHHFVLVAWSLSLNVLRILLAAALKWTEMDCYSHARSFCNFIMKHTFMFCTYSQLME